MIQLNTILLILVFTAIIVAIFLFLNKRGNQEENTEKIVRQLREAYAHDVLVLKEDFERQRREMRDDFERRAEKLSQQSLLQYQAFSAKALNDERNSLVQENRRQLNDMLEPMRQHIEGFKELVTRSYDNENKERSMLSGRIDQLMQLNRTIGDEARNLAEALRGNSKIQGDWGEMILETLLEQSGLEKDIHFKTQLTRDADGKVIYSEEGTQLRPDVVVSLPGNRSLIIDSKVSLNAFVDYMGAEDSSERKKLGQKHLESVKRHIKELGVKHYQTVVKGASEQVIMFMPSENAYVLAVRLDPKLWKLAMDNHVTLASPAHLFSIMQLTAQLWREDAQDRNVRNIAKEAGALYDKLCGFLDSFREIDKNIQKAQESYRTAYSRLAQGKGNAIGRAEKMKQLGAVTTRSIPADVASDATAADTIESNDEPDMP